MRDEDMLNILKNFDTVDSENLNKQVKQTSDDGEVVRKFADPNKDAMRSILEGLHNVEALTEELDVQQKSVNQMPGSHKMAPATKTKHPANKYLVGDIHGEEESTNDDEWAAFMRHVGKQADKDGVPAVGDIARGTVDEAAGLSDKRIMQTIEKVWNEKYSRPMSGPVGMATLVNDVMGELGIEYSYTKNTDERYQIEKLVNKFARKINGPDMDRVGRDAEEHFSHYDGNYQDAIDDAMSYSDEEGDDWYHVAKYLQKQQGSANESTVKEAPVYAEPRELAKRMWNIYNTNPEVKARVDNSPEPYRALVYTTGVIKNPEKIDGTDYWHRLIDFVEDPELQEARFGTRKPSSDVYKKQSFKDVFKSMEDAEAERNSRLEKDLYDGIQKQKKELKRGDNGKAELAEAEWGMTTANFESMTDDMKRLMSQGKTINLRAKESHLSDTYKGEIYSYKLTTEESESVTEDRADAIFDLQSIIKNMAYFGQSSESIEEEFKVNNGDTFVVLAKKIVEAVKSVRKRK